MSEILQLLLEAGLDIDQNEFMNEMSGKNDPVLIEQDGCAELLYEPEYEHWDWDDNVCRDLNEIGCLHPFALDYNDELKLKIEGQKIHRYSRILRFKFTVFQLLGLSGNVPKSVVEIVKSEIGKYIKSPSKIWNTIRAILKETGNQKYYNRIPAIIKQLTDMKPFGIDQANLSLLFSNFQEMSYLFNSELRQKWNRSYFPNMRYIALRMIGMAGIIYPYYIPLIRTFRKKKYLGEMFDDLK